MNEKLHYFFGLHDSYGALFPSGRRNDAVEISGKNLLFDGFELNPTRLALLQFALF